MPSKSKAQAGFMRAVAHSPKLAKKHGISTKVAKEFVRADKKHGTKHLPARKGK